MASNAVRDGAAGQLPLGIAILFCAGAILFPLSRVPRIEWIAHLVDLVLVMPFLVTAIRWPRRPSLAPAPAPTLSSG